MPGVSTNGLPVLTPANYQGVFTPEVAADTYAPNGEIPQSVGTPLAALGLGPPQTLTAAGTTQLGAAAITAFYALVTVAATASTHGVRLPAAVTGLSITVGNAGAFGVKVYPSTNGKIGAAATNATDTVLAVNKMNIYRAVNTTFWIVQRGA